MAASAVRVVPLNVMLHSVSDLPHGGVRSGSKREGGEQEAHQQQ